MITQLRDDHLMRPLLHGTSERLEGPLWPPSLFLSHLFQSFEQIGALGVAEGVSREVEGETFQKSGTTHD